MILNKLLFLYIHLSAEEETRKKTEKTNEIKKINTQIMILRSDITKMEDVLKEYQLYKKFLDRVTPQVINIFNSFYHAI